MPWSEPELLRQREQEAELKAERYSELHGDDDEVERPPGLIARILRWMRGGRAN